MTDQERINENLQRQIDAQNARIDNVLTKIDGLIDSFQDFKQEMRDRDNQRAKEIMEMCQKHDADMKEMRANHDADMKEMRANRDADMKEMRANHDADMKNTDSKLDEMGRHVRNMAIASMAAVGGMAITVGALVVTVIYSIIKS
ncbi:MAG: hypothetical protein IKO05_07235 [Selenomonadaceae bacterium]|nr:hypothetical protein [Selenomonadaceae bacterium]